AVSGAEVLAGDQVSYDHLDLNFGSEVFSDATVREAFLLTVPRQQILDAIAEMKLAFIMEKLAETFDVEVTEGEINNQIAIIARRQGQRFDRVRDQLAKDGSLNSLYVRLRDDKILDELISKASITEAKLEDIKARRKSGKKSEEAGSEKAEKSEESSAEAAPKPREQVKRTPPRKKKADDLADET
ncbi:MAG TPA: hypothetical protein PLQ89_17700, partial [Phycisphaerae bacterium]|nr:hypothetical protein [Phycisphaerae bacterium]